MTLDQIRAFAESRDQSIRQIALTKEGARQIIAEHEREVNAAIGDALLFEIDTTRERPAYVALERANLDRIKEASPGMDAVAAEIERQRNAGLRERPTAGQREML